MEYSILKLRTILIVSTALSVTGHWTSRESIKQGRRKRFQAAFTNYWLSYYNLYDFVSRSFISFHERKAARNIHCVNAINSRLPTRIVSNKMSRCV